MQRDEHDRPLCYGWGPSRRCNTPVHPGYSRCPWCDRSYTRDQVEAASEASEELTARDAAPAGPWLPTTPEAVRIAEAELGIWPIGLPERLKDPMAILDRHLRSRD